MDVTRPQLANFRRALSKEARPVFSRLPRDLNVMDMALRHAPLPPREFREVLRQSGEGCAMRALINLVSPPAGLRIVNVSNFQREMFGALADAAAYEIVDPDAGYCPAQDDMLGNLPYVNARKGAIGFRPEYYYLSPTLTPREIVIAPSACECCFDSQHLDYLRSTFDLSQIHALLAIRMRFSWVYNLLGEDPRLQSFTRYFKLTAEREVNDLYKGRDPMLVQWMRRAGFEETLLVGLNFGGASVLDKPLGEEARLLGHLQSEADENLYNLFWIEEGVPTDLAGNFVSYFQDRYQMKLDKNNFIAYLVFQRVRRPAPGTMHALLEEVMDWERPQAKKRFTHAYLLSMMDMAVPEERTQYQPRLDTFERQVPLLVEQFESAE
ncbi:MAG: hypothetical protein WC901_07305 [Candidatus Margulisiibacteriota bacterium]